MALEHIAKFKYVKGTSGNPAGRPKGTKNRATLIREKLEVLVKMEDPLSGTITEMTLQDAVVLTMIKKALAGDVPAAKELLDGAFGKITEKLETTVTQLPTLPTRQNARLGGKPGHLPDVKPITSEADLGD